MFVPPRTSKDLVTHYIERVAGNMRTIKRSRTEKMTNIHQISYIYIKNQIMLVVASVISVVGGGEAAVAVVVSSSNCNCSK